MADTLNAVKGPTAVLERLYEKLKFIRRVEEVIAEIYPSDKIKSPVHLSIGQEAVAVGVCDPLREDDIVSGTYRGHAAYLAKGGNLNAMMAELFGKETGCAGGRGGSMHMIALDQGILGNSAVVGSTLPIAMGYAHALKREGRGRVVVAFHGDGATEEGVFWETLNFSVLYRLPILFVCENNGLAIHEPLSKRWAVNDLRAKVAAFGLPATTISDGSVLAIREAAESRIAKMRAGEGPFFLECMTYRWREHVGPGDDHGVGYRSRADLAQWMERDQVALLGDMLNADRRARIDLRIAAQIEAAVNFAETSPFPAEHELTNNVFAD
jgi:TPP-dependent pyruvate/acetoin dehydrogenase alpha subunit